MTYETDALPYPTPFGRGWSSWDVYSQIVFAAVLACGVFFLAWKLRPLSANVSIVEAPVIAQPTVAPLAALDPPPYAPYSDPTEGQQVALPTVLDPTPYGALPHSAFSPLPTQRPPVQASPPALSLPPSPPALPSATSAEPEIVLPMPRPAVPEVVESVPLPIPRPAELAAPPNRPPPRAPVSQAPQESRTAAAPVALPDNRSFFERLFGAGRPTGPSVGYDRWTAVYDIAAHTVYMPDGSKLEAHSGLGNRLDDPQHVMERDRGATPPHLYELEAREELFHGVQALRLNPVGSGGNIFGRNGLLAHTYMLGPNGDSNGCVSFRNYDAFLQAFQRGLIKRLAVVARLS